MLLSNSNYDNCRLFSYAPLVVEKKKKHAKKKCVCCSSALMHGKRRIQYIYHYCDCLWSGCASTDKIIRRVNANGLFVDAACVRSTVCTIILFFPCFIEQQQNAVMICLLLFNLFMHLLMFPKDIYNVQTALLSYFSSYKNLPNHVS